MVPQERVLRMIFNTTGGSRWTVNINNPRTNLNSEMVRNAMEGVIAANVFRTNAGELGGINRAFLITSDITDFEVTDQDQ